MSRSRPLHEEDRGLPDTERRHGMRSVYQRVNLAAPIERCRMRLETAVPTICQCIASFYLFSLLRYNKGGGGR